jgi:hypothetical protein
MINILFGNRRTKEFSIPPEGVVFEVERYSHVAIGGPYEAVINAYGDERDLARLVDWIGSPIWLENATEGVWHGQITLIEAPNGNTKLTVDLDQMYNRVAVAYTTVATGQATVGLRGTTAWANDAESVAEFGARELLDSRGGTTADHAVVSRDRTLERAKYPQAKLIVEEELPGQARQQAKAVITCRGWWATLGWRYANIPVSLAFAYEDYTSNILLGKVSDAIQNRTSSTDYTMKNSTDAAYQQITPTVVIIPKSITLALKKTGTPADNIVIGIYATDGSGIPTGSVLATASIAASGVTGSWAEYAATLNWAWLNMAAGTVYAIRLNRSGATDASNYLTVGVDAGLNYSGGVMKVSADSGGSWAARSPDADLYFIIYTGNDSVVAFGQPFDTGPSQWNLQDISTLISVTGAPGDITIGIYENPDSLTPGAKLAEATLTAAEVGAEGWSRFTLTAPLLLAANSSYVLVISVGGVDASNFYTLALAYGYLAGPLRQKVGTTWGFVAGGGHFVFRLYTNDILATTQQIRSMLTNYGQHLRNIHMEIDSGIATESYRNGDSDYQYEIEELLDMGTANSRRMLARVDQDLDVRIYEEPIDTGNYTLGSDGHFYYYGEPIADELCPVGFWAQLGDVLPFSLDTSTLSGSASFFVEKAEYNAVEKKLYYDYIENPDDLGVKSG